MLKLIYTKAVLKALAPMPPKHFKQVASAMMELALNPTPNDSKQLSGYADLYRKDSGEYRIVYRFNDTEISVLLIGKRNDDEVYKKLKRLN